MTQSKDNADGTTSVITKKSGSVSKMLSAFSSMKTFMAKTEEDSNVIMMLGLGGAGKTSLIHGVTKDPNANPRVATPSFSVFDYHQEDQGKALYMMDYRGQNLATLIAALSYGEYEDDLPTSSPSQINSIVLVLDLIAPPANPAIKQKVPMAIDTNRVSENEEFWNSAIMQALTTYLAEDHLRYVCIFINKADLYKKELSEDDIDEIEAIYMPICTKLAGYRKAAEFEIMVGSAKDEKTITKLRNRLLEFAK